MLIDIIAYGAADVNEKATRPALTTKSLWGAMPSRRTFLGTAAKAALLTAAGKVLPAWATDAPVPIPGKDGLIVRSYRFLDLETPVEFMTNWITPVNHFFVRNHMFAPNQVNPSDWTLTITGEVEKPLTLSLSDLTKIPDHQVTNTLECAGNGRSLQSPKVPGIQWGKGAVSTGRFSGPSLKSLLEKAGIKDSAKHVQFRGLDTVPGNVPPFIRSIPVEKAMDGDTLIATHMNGETLPLHHGYPARAITPGWVGAASCKWLTEIKVLSMPAEGNFMSPGYRFPNTPGKPGEPVKPENTHSLTALIVKSLIASPAEGTKLRRGSNTIQGVAWAGEADIAKVEISTDGGASWNLAHLGKDHARYAWRVWSYRWKPSRSGEFLILSRATDSQGRVQPESPVWNPSGYLYNAYDRIRVYVQA
jgi:DMSO/TMAO reductase YedYZ molybdopterin-dependent catalytic subunit